MSSVEIEPAKWALLIGIDHYPYVNQLSGCVNDVHVMRQVLTESFAFPEDHITLLTDEQATREGILTAMKELVARAGKDDIVVFHYSGHGSQMTDREGDGPDGVDETIVPHDSGRKPLTNLDITDDEIYFWILDLTAKTSSVTLIFDCCHSGTIVRDSFGGEMRWVEADLRPLEELPPSPIPLAFRSLLSASRDLGPSGWLPLGERYVLIAGCSRDERSYEIEEPAGVRHGALTYFLSQELVKAEPGATYRDLFEIAAPRVSSRFPNQHPQLEGARDLEVLGVRRIEPMAFVPVRGREGDRVVLGAGAACGLHEGSQWAIYKAGTKTVASEEEPQGVVSITSVRAVTSDGTLLREVRPGAVAAGMRAVEESRALETLLPVQVEASPQYAADVQSLLDGLGQSKLLRRAGREELAKARVYLLPAGSLDKRKGAVPTLPPLAEETWAVVGENGELLMPSHRRYELGVVQTLLENLEKAARYRLILDLRSEKNPLADKVEVELFRWTGTRLEQPDRGGVFYEGDNLALTITNRYERPLFIYVLDLGLTGRIQLAYPVAGAEDSLLPGRTIEVGTRHGEEMTLYIPDEFPFAATSSGDQGVEGTETLKIFATTHPTDFQPLYQADFREGKAGPVSSLDDLLSATFGGGGYRDFTRPLQGSPQEDWMTLVRSFRLRRRAAAEMVAGGRGI